MSCLHTRLVPILLAAVCVSLGCASSPPAPEATPPAWFLHGAQESGESLLISGQATERTPEEALEAAVAAARREAGATRSTTISSTLTERLAEYRRTDIDGDIAEGYQESLVALTSDAYVVENVPGSTITRRETQPHGELHRAFVLLAVPLAWVFPGRAFTDLLDRRPDLDDETFHRQLDAIADRYIAEGERELALIARGTLAESRADPDDVFRYAGLQESYGRIAGAYRTLERYRSQFTDGQDTVLQARIDAELARLEPLRVGWDGLVDRLLRVVEAAWAPERCRLMFAASSPVVIPLNSNWSLFAYSHTRQPITLFWIDEDGLFEWETDGRREVAGQMAIRATPITSRSAFTVIGIFGSRPLGDPALLTLPIAKAAIDAGDNAAREQLERLIDAVQTWLEPADAFGAYVQATAQ